MGGKLTLGIVIWLGLSAGARGAPTDTGFSFPEAGDEKAQAQFCFAVQRAAAAAMSHATALHEGWPTPVRFAGLSAQGLTLIGGDAGRAEVARLTEEMRPAWESYGKSLFMPLIKGDPEAAVVEPEGMPFALAQERCWQWVESITILLFDTDQVESVDATSKP